MLRPANASHTPSPSAPAMKIMRRGGTNGDRPASTAASSSAHSKAESETGDGTNDDGGIKKSESGFSEISQRTSLQKIVPMTTVRICLVQALPAAGRRTSDNEHHTMTHSKRDHNLMCITQECLILLDPCLCILLCTTYPYLVNPPIHLLLTTRLQP
jgi:hypothetical protein